MHVTVAQTVAMQLYVFIYLGCKAQRDQLYFLSFGCDDLFTRVSMGYSNQPSTLCGQELHRGKIHRSSIAITEDHKSALCEIISVMAVLLWITLTPAGQGRLCYCIEMLYYLPMQTYTRFAQRLGCKFQFSWLICLSQNNAGSFLTVCSVLAGDLIPRHQQAFSTNQFFSGVSIPVPDNRVRTEWWGLLHVHSVFRNRMVWPAIILHSVMSLVLIKTLWGQLYGSL